MIRILVQTNPTVTTIPPFINIENLLGPDALLIFFSFLLLSRKKKLCFLLQLIKKNKNSVNNYFFFFYFFSLYRLFLRWSVQVCQCHEWAWLSQEDTHKKYATTVPLSWSYKRHFKMSEDTQHWSHTWLYSVDWHETSTP